MKRIQIYSTALSVGCAVGVLMAVILTGNKTSLPRSAVVIPTKKPLTLQASRRSTLPVRLPFQRNSFAGSNNIDRVITSSIRKKPRGPLKRGIGDIISTQELNPYPQNHETIVVKPGDTLFGIAKRSGLNAHRLAKLNGISAPFVIRPGQILRYERSE